MKIYTMPVREKCDYIQELEMNKRAKNYVWGAMQILSCSFRDMAIICGYRGDEEFQVFFRRLTKGHRLTVDSPHFQEYKVRIDIELDKAWKKRLEEEKETLKVEKGNES